MERKNNTMDENFWNVAGSYLLSFFKTYYYVFVAAFFGFVTHMLKIVKYGKKSSFWEILLMVCLAGIIGFLAYSVFDLIALFGFDSFAEAKGEVRSFASGAAGLFSELIYKRSPKFFGNLIKGKLNIKEDCKIDE